MINANLINMKVVPRLVAPVVIYLVAFMPGAGAVDTQTITQYAGRLLTPLQYVAAIELWTMESNLRISARNGSHYGICQGRSKYMATANYRQQVRWCISYAYNRYGSMTAALAYWKVHKWH